MVIDWNIVWAVCLGLVVFSFGWPIVCYGFMIIAAAAYGLCLLLYEGVACHFRKHG